MQSVPRVRRISGAILIALGVAVLASGSGLALLATDKGSWMAGAFQLTLLPAILLVFFGRRLRAITATETLARDTRAPILFLRAFGTDELPGRQWYFLLSNYGVWESKEQALSRLFSYFGPFIAIGRPGERLPPLGAARDYLANADWKAAVGSLIERAQFVIIRVGDSDALLWEFATVVAQCSPLRVALYCPIDAMWGKRRRAREEIYARFRLRTAHLLPRSLPDKLGMAEMVMFRPDWTGSALELQGKSLWAYVRGWGAGSELPHMRDGMKPIFDQLKVSPPPIPWSAMDCLTVPGIVIVGSGFLGALAFAAVSAIWSAFSR